MRVVRLVVCRASARIGVGVLLQQHQLPPRRFGVLSNQLQEVLLLLLLVVVVVLVCRRVVVVLCVLWYSGVS